jgi:hypothetical protein
MYYTFSSALSAAPKIPLSEDAGIELSAPSPRWKSEEQSQTMPLALPVATFRHCLLHPIHITMNKLYAPSLSSRVRWFRKYIFSLQSEKNPYFSLNFALSEYERRTLLSSICVCMP